MSFDTIAAIATGTARSAIGIVRLSGPDAIQVVDQIFHPSANIRFATAENRKLIFGRVLDEDGAILDECLATLSRAPNSYTGENTCELQCHGSPVVLSSILQLLFHNGVRQALPGEFTKRAFLNGRMDLAQAEAVIDLIDASSSASAKNAAGQLSGAFSRRIDAIYDRLADVAAHFDSVLDYSDEDLEPFQIEELSSVASVCLSELNQILSTAKKGMNLRNGIPCSIIGAPNAGKSSLLNRLLGYDRAIVTQIPGTTRDVLRETLEIGGLPIILSDTAGLRDTEDEVEKIGVKRSIDCANNAELVLLVIDGSKILSVEDIKAIQIAEQLSNVICIINKSDLKQRIETEKISKLLPCIITVSAETGEGIPELEKLIRVKCGFSDIAFNGELLTNIRQIDAVSRAKIYIEHLQDGLNIGITPDALLTDAEQAMLVIGEITGRSVTEDITDRIFSRFCVGK